MLKVQKLLNYIYLNIKEKDIINKYHQIRSFPYDSEENISKRQLSKLNLLLNHAYNNVPYYKNILDKSGIVQNSKINLKSLNEFAKIDFLTKEIINKEQSSLYSLDIDNRKKYKNMTGGSTGRPIVFMQDREYQINNLANFYIVRSWRGADPYDSTIMLWGAERDTFQGKKSFIDKIKDFILNLIRLNTFQLTPKIIEEYIKILNKEKPKIIIAYVQSIYEMAKYAKENHLFVEKQKAIHAAAGTVYDFMRNEIEEVFQTKIFNHYGSREVGSIASECDAHLGLHILMDHTLVEIIDNNGDICKPGEEGKIVITTLNNYSMPLIRYEIGDIGIMQEYSKCSCGCNYKKLQKVVGRTTDVFKTSSGSTVMAEYFIHLIGVVYNKGNIELFQIIQEDINKILIKIVPKASSNEIDFENIEKKIKLVMGRECTVEFKLVKSISKTKTGKFLYTISHI